MRRCCVAASRRATTYRGDDVLLVNEVLAANILAVRRLVQAVDEPLQGLRVPLVDIVLYKQRGIIGHPLARMLACSSIFLPSAA